MIKEACVESILEALTAEKEGADRIELCENLAVGGTTPSYGTIKYCKKYLNIPFFAMIRPRGGNFVYSKKELEIMKEDIKVCKLLGADGVVFGLLDENNQVDVNNTKMLVELAKPMQVTYHKAFDEVADPEAEMEKLIECGVDRILTSGTKPTALEGEDILNKLLIKGDGRIKLVIAGRVTEENLEHVKQTIPATEFHGRRIVFNPDNQ
ncbi:copper homeostasis protein CutC [Puteibacter caeruleilacunae]|nr:copper homeostasis protein CutC [Puteibacter caeruleilacunae]